MDLEICISMGKNEIVMCVQVHMCVVTRAQPLVSFLLRSRLLVWDGVSCWDLCSLNRLVAGQETQDLPTSVFPGLGLLEHVPIYATFYVDAWSHGKALYCLSDLPSLR